jgi:hypothetical protein
MFNYSMINSKVKCNIKHQIMLELQKASMMEIWHKLLKLRQIPLMLLLCQD